MTPIKAIRWFALLALTITGCREESVDLFERPEWLTGKVYAQILEQPELSTFARGIELIGYDTIIDVSGNYTIFAPSDEAFDSYFAGNPNYSSLEQIPIRELKRLIKYHIVQNPWSKRQLKSLDVFGWIDLDDPDNNKPRGYKRETLLLDEDEKYGVSKVRLTGTNYWSEIIVDTLKSNWRRRVLTDSRKHAPIFFQEYLDIHDLGSGDYEFYFDRTFEGGDEIYYVNAKIASEEIFAENGFIYVVDQVVEPLDNAYQFLSQAVDNRYSDFLDLVNLFPEFVYNEEATFDQPGAEEGFAVDSLFNLIYPSLAFDINREQTYDPSGTSGLPENVTIRFHNGLVAPTNAALAQLEQDYFQIDNGWGSIDEAPLHLKRTVVNSHMANNPIYASDITDGFYNGELDLVRFDQSAITQKEYGSNTTLIGLDQPVVPRAFSSVAGPVYLKRGYSNIMYAIEYSRLLPALKRPDENYMFFVESDASTSSDSSFFFDQGRGRFTAIETGGTDFTEYILSIDDIRTLLLNHIASDQPLGIARKEFIPNLAGNYIIVNNQTGEISGTAPTTYGFRGTDAAPGVPSVLSEDVDNGITYDIDNWFSFATASLYATIAARYPKFHALLGAAGLTEPRLYRYNFISEGELYSVLIPSDAALDSAQIDTLTLSERKNILKLHFVKGDLIFTDGKKSAGYYKTLRVDEESTPISTVFTQIYIEPGTDVIRIHNSTGGIYAEIQESESNNQLTAINKGEGGEVIPVVQNNAVIHRIDTVLRVDELDTGKK